MSNPLSRVAMQKILRERNPKINLIKEDEERNLNTIKQVKLEGNLEGNFTKDQDSILKGIIRGERQVIESTGKNSPISLEEAANKIKKNP